MLYAIDCWEYDIKAAGKTFLEKKGFKLPDKKEDYVIKVGLIFKDYPELQQEFYDEMRQVLLENLPPDTIVYRYYVDEVIVDKPIDTSRIQKAGYQVKQKHLKFLLLEHSSSFVKVYDDSIKISGSFKWPAYDVWKDVADVVSDATRRHLKQKQLWLIGRKVLALKYPTRNYIFRTKSNRLAIATKRLIFYVDDPNNIPAIDDINESVYHKLLMTYIHPLF
jgi:hypothetical protein